VIVDVEVPLLLTLQSPTLARQSIIVVP